MISLKLTLAATLAVAAFVLTAPQKATAEGWSFSVGAQSNSYAYQSMNKIYGGDGEGATEGLGGITVDADDTQKGEVGIPFGIMLKAEYESDLHLGPWALGGSVGLGQSRARVAFKDGHGAFVDPFDIKVKIITADARIFLTRPLSIWGLEARLGLGLSRNWVQENTDYGVLQLEEKRIETLASTYARLQRPFGQTPFGQPLMFGEITGSELGLGVVIGLEQRF